MHSPPPVALTISGSDSSAGAGLQADLKTFSRFGVHGLTVVTSVMAQTPLAVADIRGVEPRLVREQIRVLLEAFPVGAAKTGVLHSREHVLAVAQGLEGCEAPLVIDPAMLTSTGESLISQEAVEAYKHHLFPAAVLMTPNLQEARYLLGGERRRVKDPIDACARNLHEEYGCAVLVTGMRDRERGLVVDYLMLGGEGTRLESPWIELPYAHGTGCTFSSAIVAGLCRGRPLAEAIGTAEKFINHALREAFHWEREGRDLMVLNHLTGEVFGEG